MKDAFQNIYLFLLFFGCSSQETIGQTVDVKENFADVKKVAVSGKNGSFTFSVTLASPDQGCNQYADWWEVISVEGDLVYRRILAHSHVKEQPFTRSGGDVNVSLNQIVWVRAHLNNTGYGGKTFKGSNSSGFAEVDMPEKFALNIEKESPQPTGCTF